MIIHMHIALGEGNADPLGIKLFFDFLGGVEEKRPVIIRRGPDPHFEVDTAVGQLSNDDLRRRIFQNTCVLIDNLLDNAAGFINS